MRNVLRPRWVLLPSVAMAVAGCDLALFALDPKPPIIEQTWNFTADKQTIKLTDLLPSGGTVTIPSDSLSFALKIDSTNITRVVGSDCAQCVVLNGTNAPKPQFILNAGNSTPLPSDIVKAAITAGTLSIRLVNNMSFDPLYVNTNPAATVQGYMLIVVRSGSVVLARDSVRGAAAVSGTQNSPFPKLGGILNRTIPLTTGTVTTNLTFDVTVNSPIGDHNEFINANGTLNAVASVPSINVASVDMNVPSRTINTGGTSIPFKDVPGASKMVACKLTMDFTNPFTGITGALNVQFKHFDPGGGSATITKSMTLPSGVGSQTVTLDSTNVDALVKADSVTVTVLGPVSSATAVTVTPKQKVTIATHLIAVIHLGREDKKP